LHNQKQNGSLISTSREDRIIKVLHQETGSRKLLAEFLTEAFEMIPTVFTVLETCIFSVNFLKIKNITTQETQFSEILHTVPK